MFGEDVIAAIKHHAREAYPLEACGIVVGGAYQPLPNVASDPTHRFELPSEVMQTPGLQAIVHSHPDGHPWPSREDMEGQIATAVTWGVVPVDSDTVGEVLWWGDDVPIPPLLGREFRPGPSGSDGKGDCYALIRDWFRVHRSVTLPEFPRSHEWWLNGENLYIEGFREAGFEEISFEELQAGDVVLARVMSPVPNHGGIVLANGLVLHHLQSRLSRAEPLGPWRRFVTHALRYVGPLGIEVEGGGA